MVAGVISHTSRKRAHFNREPLVVQAARLIRSAILNGDYKLGERLVEADLAERYGAGRHSIRDALQILEGEQLVVSDAFRGRSVIQPSTDEIACLFLIRVSLECVAAALAAYRITPDDIQRLRDQAQVTPESFFDLGGQNEWDAAIHRLIWQIAGEPMLLDYLERLISPAMKLTQEVFQNPGQAVAVEELIRIENNPDDPGSHWPVVEAICCQNAPEARSAMVKHLTCTRGSRQMRDLFAVAFGVS